MSNIKDIIIYVLASCLFLFVVHYIYKNFFKNKHSDTTNGRSSSVSSDSSSFEPLKDSQGRDTLGGLFGGKRRNKKIKNKGRNKK
jgi:hypothetical protein